MVGEICKSNLFHFQHGLAYSSLGNLTIPLLLRGYYVDTELNRHLIEMAHYSQLLLDSGDLLASVTWVARTTRVQHHTWECEQLCMLWWENGSAFLFKWQAVRKQAPPSKDSAAFKTEPRALMTKGWNHEYLSLTVLCWLALWGAFHSQTITNTLYHWYLPAFIYKYTSLKYFVAWVEIHWDEAQALPLWGYLGNNHHLYTQLPTPPM